MADNALAEKIGELGTSLASIKEQVGNLATDFTSKLAANGTVSAELKEKTDKALSDLGAVTTRLGDLEKRAARERENGEDEHKSLGDMVVESASYIGGGMTSSTRGSLRVATDRAALTTA
ncbi:MAG: phage major capsid protein, partial [Pseudomonas sp.]